MQGTFETFVEAGRQHYNNDLTGKWILTAGLGGMGGAQPLAGVLAGACVLARSRVLGDELQRVVDVARLLVQANNVANGVDTYSTNEIDERKNWEVHGIKSH